MQNAYIESFNGRLRDECLNENVFTDLDDALAPRSRRLRRSKITFADPAWTAQEQPGAPPAPGEGL